MSKTIDNCVADMRAFFASGGAKCHNMLYAKKDVERRAVRVLAAATWAINNGYKEAVGDDNAST